MLEKLQHPGEHPLFVTGPTGQIEAILTVPENAKEEYIAILGHPHSLQGGTMNNKVVTTMMRAFKELGIPSIRFNFRGVGQSGGTYDAGLGESEDMLYLARLCREEKPEIQFFFAGFSFGSYVAYRAAAQFPNCLLITIAPAVNHCDYNQFKTPPDPWVVIQGDEDEVVPSQMVLDFAAQQSPPLPVVRFPDTGHFFHGKLLELKSTLIEAIGTQVTL
jgi:alpha/beta superfamily hydrolase